MSLERAVFVPIERLADALYPYRWRFVVFTLFVSVFPFALAFAGRRFWPEHGGRVVVNAAPVVMTLIVWAWSANLIAVWFGPRRHRPRVWPHVLPRVREAFSVLFRVWGLVVLVAFLLSPFFIWFLFLS